MTRGRHPKPAHLRQNRTKKAGRATLSQLENPEVPALLNPDGREWHSLTLSWWDAVWQSPMAGEYMPTDLHGLGRVAILVDKYYKNPIKETLAEIRLQESRFGLSPLDRSRLQWEVAKSKEAERKRKSEPKGDPRAKLGVV